MKTWQGHRCCQSFSMLHPKMSIICWTNCVNKWYSHLSDTLSLIWASRRSLMSKMIEVSRVMGMKDNQSWNKSSQINSEKAASSWKKLCVRRTQEDGKETRKESWVKERFFPFCPTDWQMPLAQCQDQDAIKWISLSTSYQILAPLPGGGPVKVLRVCFLWHESASWK